MFAKESLLYKLVENPYVKVKLFIRNRCLPDSWAISLRYRREFGKFPNLKHPITLNEKIQWLKLNDRTPLHTLCADKFLAREYVEKKIGSKYLIPLLFHTNDVNDVKPENLPDIPLIIKTNHDSSGGIVVINKDEQDWDWIRKELKLRLKKNYYTNSKEWQYKNIEPHIIVEQLLEGNPYDYKVHCFNKKCVTIQVDIDRHSNHKRNWYNSDWQREEFEWSSVKDGGKKTLPADYDIECPNCISEMLSLSEKLAEDFIYARADWYIVNDKLYFGEISFHHDSGYRPILPQVWDEKLGSLLKLPIDE